MRRLAILAGFVLAGATIAAAAVAQEPRPQGRLELMLRMADPNGDGSITAAEARSARERTFARMDANADGFLTDSDRETRSDGARQRAGARMKGARDADADGRISRAEFLADEPSWFTRFDANNNDVLEPAEIAALRQRAGQARDERTPPTSGQAQ